MYTQLYTIHAEKDGVIFPCIYALLPNKTEEINDRLFKKLLEIEPLNPSTIMIGLSKAALNPGKARPVASDPYHHNNPAPLCQQWSSDWNSQKKHP